MLTAIINKLKTGTIKTVVSRGDGVKNLTPPYVVVWEDAQVSAGNAQANGGFFVSCHNVIGTEDDIRNYLSNEVIGLLHKINLTTNDTPPVTFRLEDTMEMSALVQSNDDGTISRDRLFLLPQLGAV